MRPPLSLSFGVAAPCFDGAHAGARDMIMITADPTRGDADSLVESSLALLTIEAEVCGGNRKPFSYDRRIGKERAGQSERDKRRLRQLPFWRSISSVHPPL